MKKILIILLLAVSLVSQATVWHIATTGNDGTGDGTVGTPWLTLAYAITQASSGDSIYVTAGTYDIGTQVDSPVGISIYGAGATSILRATAAVNPMIELSSAVQGTEGNQSISFLKFDGNGLTGTWAININLRSNVTVHDLTVEDFSSRGVQFRGTGATHVEPTTYSTGNSIYNCTFINTNDRGGAIRASGQDGLLIYDNVITSYQRALGHDPTNVVMTGGAAANPARGGWNKGIKFYNNTSNMDRVYFDSDGTTPLWGFHVESWDVMGGFEFYNNTFNGGHVPIDIGGTFNVKGDYDYSWDIHNNVWQWSAQWPTDVDGSWGMVFEGGVQDLIIRNNYFRNVPWGIHSSIVQSPRLHKNIHIHHNVMENIGWGNSVWGFGMWIAGGAADAVVRDINIYNNVISGGTSGTGSITGGIILNSSYDISNVKIRNNVIQNVVNYGCIGFWDGAGTIDSITIQNNILHNNVNSSNFYYRNGKTVSYFVNNGDIKSDPLFVSSSDFHLQATSPGRDAGLDVSAITGGTDFHGASLSGAAYDIGAFEYGTGRLVNIGTTIPTINYKLVLIDH